MVLAFVLLAVYLVFWHDDSPLQYGQTQPPPAEVLNGYLQDLEAAEQAEADRAAAEQASKGYIDLSPGVVDPPEPKTTWEPIPEPTQYNDWIETSTSSAELEVATIDPEPDKGRIPLQEQFETESVYLEQLVTLMTEFVPR